VSGTRSRLVGNDMDVARPRLQMAPATPVPAMLTIPFQAVSNEEFIPVTVASTPQQSPWSHFMDFIHAHSLIVFALLFLMIAGTGAEVGEAYWSAHITLAKPAVASKSVIRPTSGLNMAVASNQLQTELQRITAQPISVNLGTQTVSVSPATIKSWVSITPDNSTAMDYLHVNNSAIASSLSKQINQYVKAPVNQVTATHPDGTSAVIVAGRNGTKLSDTANLSVQAQQIATNLFSGKGFQVSAPLVSLPFQSVTPAAFDKLIEVNLSAKQMWVYDHGNLLKQYAVSAGKPSTPTPVGEFHVYEKLPVQDMWGYNPDGTKYFQPHVYWISYFTGGDAVHGVYWHPLSWFGVHNSSHGCVGLPDDEAQWVYNWDSIGTTVITYN
jgi:lipoprotein-anchoring transpeptidase ErfK/SrfK